MTTTDLLTSDPRLRRLAGAGALAHVVAFLATAAVNGQPTVHEGQEGIEHSLVEGGLGSAYGSMYVLTLGFLVLLPTMVFLARSLGRRTAAGAMAAQTALLAGTCVVVIIVGVGFSAGAAALWGMDQGLDLKTVLAVNNVRNFSYFVVTPVMGMYALALGISALADRQHSRWIGWGGVAVGGALLLAVPAAALGIQYAMPVWLLWWAGIGVSLLRSTAPAEKRAASEPQTDRVAVREDRPAR